MQTMPTPWIQSAGEFYARVYADAESSDQLTRLSAQCKWGMAKEELAKATSTVSFLKQCLELDPGMYKSV